MKSLVFYTSTNRKGKHDATGAFIPEALAFAKIHEVPKVDVIAIPQNIPPWDRRYLFRSAVRKRKKYGETYDGIVYLGHGSKSGLPGLGMGYRVKPSGTPEAMADLLSPILEPWATVVLYTCLAGKGFGYADDLFHEFGENMPCGPTLVAHLSRGHTTFNPWAEYSGEGPDGAGRDIIERDDPLWPRWRAALKADQWFRLSFPFMAHEQILAYLEPKDKEFWTCSKCGHKEPK